ncbi:MAG: extracellular solute-binding protein, partial [Acutalibacteraceae bacterium]
MKKLIALCLAITLFFVAMPVTSSAASYTCGPGDINGDGKVNNKDLGLLMQKINGWNVEIVGNNGDVNADDKVNNKDLGLIMQFINGWDVQLTDNGSGNRINDNVNPEKYRGTTVKFAATINPANDESGPVVKAFEKKYGIKVEIVQSDQGNYANQMAGLIAAGKSPDVARCNGDFPTCMGYLQSLDAAKLDYNESIWKQNTFKLST